MCKIELPLFIWKEESKRPPGERLLQCLQSPQATSCQKRNKKKKKKGASTRTENLDASVQEITYLLTTVTVKAKSN